MTTPPPGSRGAQALDEIEAALAEAETELKVAHEALGEFANILSREPYEANRAYDAMSDVQAASRRIPTLRAALAPAADVAGEVEEIRKRLSDRKPSGPRGHVPPLTQSERDMATLLRLLSEERARRVEWQPIETAPRDGQYILAIVGKNDSQHMAHLEGRVFSIRPEPFGAGWSVYPGYGGAPSEWFTCWKPLDLPATHKDTQDE